ncbi:MAG: FAD-binding oxidoreductase [Scytonematopsis contorta HA4267-MV1]|jgi:glycine/D-amino acid oxidase-like deaminating enzyme|nr:FAD-binding oxidoreductase [Scytonematopsis contorta HA4267-MV1]
MYDWIIIGAGFTGAALAYELIQKGFSVLLLEKYLAPNNATRYSYGGLAFWSGNTELIRQLCDESIARYEVFSKELAADIEFRWLDLLLTIAKNTEPEKTAAIYANVATPPQLLTVKEACELEPLLNRNAISGALTVKHGHINPEKTVQAYIQAFLRKGGAIEFTEVLEWQSQNKVSVKTTNKTYDAANVAICAGGMSRQLLKASGIPIKLYFSHAEIIEIPPVNIKLNTLVMPANLKRFQLETESSKFDELWDESGNEILPPILDAGAVQFQDGSLRLGQITRTIADVNAKIKAADSQEWLRKSVGEILPSLGNLPRTWGQCLVAFSSDKLPLIGAIPGFENVHIFSGFSNPLVIVPPLAQRFANSVSGVDDEMINSLSPGRFCC